MTNDQIAEEINRIIRCVDFTFDRNLRHNATEAIDALKLARALISRPRPDAPVLNTSALDEAYVMSLEYADKALEDLREDVESIERGLRRPYLDNLDDAQDTIGGLIHVARNGLSK